MPRSKGPWKNLRAESYSLFLSVKDLPKGTHDEFEKAWDEEEMGKFVGGLGAVIIVRYSETPVGMCYFVKIWQLSSLIETIKVRMYFVAREVRVWTWLC